MKLSIPALLILASFGLAACEPTEPVSFHPKGGVPGGPRVPEPHQIPPESPTPTPPVDEGAPSFELSAVEPATLTVRPGDEKMLRVTIERIDGYERDVEVGLVNLPAGVSAETVVLSGAAVEAEIVVVAEEATAILEPVEAFARAQDADGTRSKSFRLQVRGENGELDRSYGGGDGIAPIAPASIPGSFGAAALATLADGRVVVASSSSTGGIVVTRLAADGSLDATFGNGGATEVLVGAATSAQASDLVSLADGGVLVAGTVQRYAADGFPSGSDVVLVRLDAQGTLTAGFGMVFLDLAPDERATAVVADATGAVVAGVAQQPGLDPEVFLARVTLSSGALDVAFGGGTGVVLEVAPDGPHDLAQAPDGKLVLAAGTRTTRYLGDGSRDATFGSMGDALSTHDGAARAVLVQPDGKVLVAASHFGAPVIARFFADGTPDSGFGAAGSSGIAGAARVDALALDASGRIAGAGRASGNVAVFRLLSDGVFDATFAGGTVARHDAGGADAATGVELLPDGRLVLSGETPSDLAPPKGFVLRVWAD